MPDIYMDHLSALAGKEERGAVRSLTRTARIVFSQEELDDEIDDIRSPDILMAAMDALDEDGYYFGSFLDTENARWNALVLVGREPKLAMSDSQNCVDVSLTYQHVLDGANQFGRSDDDTKISVPVGKLWGKYRTGIVEKTTNFFYPQGDSTKEKELIVVSYTYPLWDIRIGGIPHDPADPRTIYQGGEISIPFPQSNYKFDMVIACTDAVKLANAIRRKINLLPWLGYKEFTWLCSSVEIEMLAREGGFIAQGKSLYKFSFEFQHNSDGWKPTVAYADPQNNKPPSGVDDQKGTLIDPISLATSLRISPTSPTGVAAAAMWEVPCLPELDFGEYFGQCQFEGVATAIDFGG